jgi:hypothetical protein
MIFENALREVMREDLLRAEQSILAALEKGDDDLLLQGCSSLYDAFSGYDLIIDRKIFRIDYPICGHLCLELAEGSYVLGQYLHENGRWADYEVIEKMVAAIFFGEEVDAESP